MAWQVCKSCNKDFDHPYRGRPPTQCPTCRENGIRVPVKPRPATLVPLVVETLPPDDDEYTSVTISSISTVPSSTAPEDVLRKAIEQIAGEAVSIDQVRAEAQAIANDVISGRKTELFEEMARKAESLIDDDRIVKLIQTAGVQRIEMAWADKKVELPATSHELLPKVITVLQCRRNLFMVGPAGSGKSTAVMQAAEVLGLRFGSMSFGPTTPTSKLFGYMDATGNYVSTEFRKCYENGGVFLGDEIDNGHPGLVAELNQAIANGYCAFADGMVSKHEDFVFVATGNTFGKGPDRLFVGRNILDAATLDRFVTMEFGIDEGLERRIAIAWANDENDVEKWIDYVQAVRKRVVELKLPVVVSPRATIDGAMLLAAGMEWNDVKAMRLFAGIKDDQREKIEGR